MTYLGARRMSCQTVLGHSTDGRLVPRPASSPIRSVKRHVASGKEMGTAVTDLTIRCPDSRQTAQKGGWPTSRARGVNSLAASWKVAACAAAGPSPHFYIPRLMSRVSSESSSSFAGAHKTVRVQLGLCDTRTSAEAPEDHQVITVDHLPRRSFMRTPITRAPRRMDR